MLMRSPTITLKVIMELPPKLTKGRGIPTTGKRPRVMRMFTEYWKRRREKAPTTKRVSEGVRTNLR